MNNIQKAFKAKSKLGLHMADGGFAFDPSLMQAPSSLGMADGGQLPRRDIPIVGTHSPLPSGGGGGLSRGAVAATVATPPAAPPKTGLAALTSNPITNPQGVVQDRMKAAGLADGGRVRGPGTGTSDSVPARYSNGEYVLPADTTAAIGVENLDALKDATHTPVSIQRGLRMANGGQDNRWFPLGSTAPAPAPAAPAPNLSSGFGPALTGHLNAPTMSQVYGGSSTATPPAALPPRSTNVAAVINDPRDNNPTPPPAAMANPAAPVGLSNRTAWDARAPLAAGPASTTNAAPTDSTLAGDAPSAPQTPADATALSLRGGLSQPADLDRTGMAGANANIRQSLRGLADNQSTNVSTSSDKILASKGANGRLVLTGTGTSDGMAGDQLQRELTAQKVNDMNRTAAIQGQVNGLRTAFYDRDATHFGGDMGGSGSRLVSAATANARNAAEANAVNERNSLRANDTARWTGERQLAQNLRQMTWDRNKFGIEQGNKQRELGDAEEKNNLEARSQGQKWLSDNLAATTPVGPDGKPDTVAIARKTTAVNSYLGDRARALQQHLQLNPGDAGAAAELRNINERGASGLDPQILQKIAVGTDAAGVAAANSSGAFNPIGGRAVISNAPITSLRDDHNGILGFGGTFTSNRGDKIPKRAIQGDGSFFGGLRNNQFDSLIQKDNK